MRGGTSYMNKKYSKANNKYFPDYDKKLIMKQLIEY